MRGSRQDVQSYSSMGSGSLHITFCYWRACRIVCSGSSDSCCGNGAAVTSSHIERRARRWYIFDVKNEGADVNVDVPLDGSNAPLMESNASAPLKPRLWLQITQRTLLAMWPEQISAMCRLSFLDCAPCTFGVTPPPSPLPDPSTLGMRIDMEASV